MADENKKGYDISKLKIKSTGLSKKKVIGVTIIIFAFLLLALFLQYGLSGNKEVAQTEKVDKEEEIVKEDIMDKEAEERFQSELRKSYSEQTKKTYENKTDEISELKEISDISDEVNNGVENTKSIDYEKERLMEVKAKISAYKDRVFQEELASRSSGIGEDTKTSLKMGEENKMNPNIPDFSRGIPPTPPLNNNDRMTKYKGNMEVDSVYNKYNLIEPVSNFELKSGGIIPIILYTGINTDIPSKIIAVVREDIYDSKTGNYLLIPKGTKVIGTYDSVLDFGQERVLLVWTRLVFPNGKSISLDKFDGVDLSGYGGSGGKVDSHFGTMLKAVVLSTVLSIGDYYVSPSSKDRNRYKTSSPEVIAKEETVNTFSEIGKEYVGKMLDVQPTIIVKQGTRLNIIVNSDLILEPYME